MPTQRSQEKELIDLGPEYYSHQEHIQCLKKLFKINKFLGFFRGSVKVLKKLPPDATLVDVGCGSGLFLLNLSKIFPQMRMLGLDICPEAIKEAMTNLEKWQTKIKNINVKFQRQANPELTLAQNSVDVILVTLVCHHLSDADLIQFLSKAQGCVRHVVIINDLQRHRISEKLFAIFSPLFRNRMLTYDGVISIRRGFTRKELKFLLQEAGIVHYQIKWCLPFRWKVLIWKRADYR